MATQQITIDGSNGVYNVFKERRRWTIYEYIGTFRGEINESKVLLRLIADNEVRLIGFAVAPEITNNPFIGGFENEKPKPPIPDIDPPSGVFELHILPCIDEYATLKIWSEELTKKNTDLVEFQLLTHSLTYNEKDAKEGRLAKCEYTLRDAGGMLWANMVQHKGAKAAVWGGTCGNNHPRHEDIDGLKYDCKVYIPKRTFFLDIKNTGDCDIMPWVHHPDTEPNENRDIYKQTLGVGQSITIEIPSKEFNGPFHKNAIKINANNV